MSSLVANNQSRQKIQQLLAAIGSKPAELTAQIKAVEYDWRQPHYFSGEQLKKLDSFTAKVAQACSEKFAQHYHSNFHVKIVSAEQYFAGEFATSNNAQNDYCLAFGTDQNHIFGFVGIPAQAAIIWITQLLGDSKPAENYNKELSQLEKSLLLDIGSSVVEAFSNSDNHYNLRPAAEFVRGELPIKLKGDEELCKIAFSAEKTGSGNLSEAYFLIFCDKLEVVTGRNAQTSGDSSAKDITKAMLSYVHKVPVTVTSRLASTEITFEEITNLSVDDIVLLDKKVNAPVELIIEGKTLFRGRLAKSDGRQAVVITELCNTK